MGVSVVEILLHVGLGTFRPVKAENIEDHQMHSEYYEVSEENAAALNACRAAGGRIVCVGTTSCRTLETATDEAGVVHAQSGWTDIFITPGYRFKAVDALVTNFHLRNPRLLMLVSALFHTRRDAFGLPPRGRGALPVLLVWRRHAHSVSGQAAQRSPPELQIPGGLFCVCGNQAGIMSDPTLRTAVAARPTSSSLHTAAALRVVSVFIV